MCGCVKCTKADTYCIQMYGNVIRKVHISLWYVYLIGLRYIRHNVPFWKQVCGVQ